MPATLFTVLDDIAVILDDVAVMTKVATKRTAGVLADDLAVNAEQVSGVAARRELPVVWAVAKGSALNKAIIVPTVLAIGWLAPWGIVPLLMLGGAFLCFEGAEKLAHRLFHPKEEPAPRVSLADALAAPDVDVVALERTKIRGAIRTDFILSAEIVVISLGTVAEASFGMKVAVLVAISVIMTVGVYGLVAVIVKADDVGLALMRRDSAILRGLGRGIVATAPRFMKLLSWLGTIAMFLVGGGILVHGVPPLHHFVAGLEAGGGLVGFAAPVAINALAGLLTGVLLVALYEGGKRLVRRKA
ncbi:MAG: DUF808 domain-containing protein, partial [Sandaracinaceae bacterium]|nr:DUF808 domain-containing protein [Sandaracinaceae bacterium]